MGTRADFYFGRGESAEWIGSIALDGYPDGIPILVRNSTTEDDFRKHVLGFIGSKNHGTTPEMGWPWPWPDSRSTDYAYAFDGGKVWASCFGHEWFDPLGSEPEIGDVKECIFPDMTSRKNMPPMGSDRSGLIVAKG